MRVTSPLTCERESAAPGHRGRDVRDLRGCRRLHGVAALADRVVASSAYLHLFDEHQDANPAQRVTAEEAIRQGRVRTGYWKSAEANGA
jgi:hypothetical protein